MCRKFFLLYYGESIDRLKRRQKYLVEIGTVPPAHGNAGKKPKHAYSRNTIEAVLNFISNFTAIHGLPDPGRDLRAGKGKLTIYLPTIRIPTLKDGLGIQETGSTSMKWR